MLAGLVAVVAGGAADELDQPVEGLVDLAVEQVEVGGQGLRLDVVGRGVGGRAGCGRRRRRSVRWSTFAMASPAAASASAGLAVDQLLVLRDGGVVVLALERVLGRRVARVERRLAVLASSATAARPGGAGAVR